jgi:hypothetical protein
MILPAFNGRAEILAMADAAGDVSTPVTLYSGYDASLPG